MADTGPGPSVIGREGGRGRWPALGLILAVALTLRIAAAVAVSWYVAGQGKLCVFPDTIIYVELARTVVAGEPYQVSQAGVPHYSLRTPGYPVFLAGCRLLFGPSLLAARLVQAVLGTLAVWLVARLARATVARPGPDRGAGAIVLVAAGLAAVDPYIVGMSALALSEGIFIPLMVAGLWGMAALWRAGGEDAPRRPGGVALMTGVLMGLAVLARPSWLLFIPAVLAAWLVGSGPGRRRAAARGAAVVALGVAVTMAPWWIRNHAIHGRFVPTALWVGASLYDGVGPQANGESDMRFVEEPDVRALGEVEQEATFRVRSIRAIAADPVRIARLALVKLGRFWSPWPNASMFRSPKANALSALATLPVFALLMLGAWDRRKDARALALLLGPLLYFCALHLIFVSSIRYRIPGMVPAMGLAGVGWSVLSRARSSAREGGPA